MKKRLIAIFVIITICLGSTGVSVASFENTDIHKRYIVKLNSSAPLLMSANQQQNHNIKVVDRAQLDMLVEAGMVEWYEEDYEVELFDTGFETDNQDENISDDNQSGDNTGDNNQDDNTGDDNQDDNTGNNNPSDDEADEAPKKYGQDRWDLETIKPDMAYMLNCMGQGVRIGIIDSGIANHSELEGRILPGKNYIDGSDNTVDEYGHGTFIAGIIASADDGKGIIGVAPKSSLVPLKCFDGNTTSLSKICDAIYGAVDDFDCDIINMSFGLTQDTTALKEAIDYAISKNVIIVAATGNKGGTDLYYPAAYDNVIGVGSVNSSQVVSPTSQHNQSVWLTAPGSSVTSLSINGGYKVSGGTSFAAAYVTGAISAFSNIKQSISVPYIKEVFALCSQDKGDEGYDYYYGHGILDMEKCIQKLLENVSIFISQPTKQETNYSVLLYNNTENEFSGSFIYGEYNDGIMKSFSQLPVNILSRRTVTTQLAASDNSLKAFVWESTKENSAISNTRSILGNNTAQSKDGYIKVTPTAKEIGTNNEFSLTLYNKNGTEAYVVQDWAFEDDEYALYIPESDILDEDSEEGITCKIKIDAVINGLPCIIPAIAHSYEAVSVTKPTPSEKGYTTYVCSVCSDEYAGDETDALGYIVSYVCEGAQNIPEAQNKKHGDELVITSATPQKEGFEFCGWTSTADSDCVEYTPGSIYATDADITLYPVWKPKEYKLIYMIDDEEYETQTVSYGATIIAISAPEKSGYTFSEWEGIPSVMPAMDVTVNGVYTRNRVSGSSGRGSGGGGRVSVVAPVPQPEASTQPDQEQYTVYLFGYNDINQNDWFFEGVKFMLQSGLMVGTSEKEFSPEEKLLRAMFVVILYRLEGSPAVTEQNAFEDVKLGDYYYHAVNWAVNNKIVNGTSETLFSPEAAITREQMAVMLYRYAIYKGYKIEILNNLQYSDSADVSDFAKTALKWATGQKLINGSDGCLYPRHTATRAEAATVFTRFIKSNDK